MTTKGFIVERFALTHWVWLAISVVRILPQYFGSHSKQFEIADRVRASPQGTHAPTVLQPVSAGKPAYLPTEMG